MLTPTRDLFAVANLLVELSSVKHAAHNHQHNCHVQYNTHSSRVTKFVFSRDSAPDPAGGAHDVPNSVVKVVL